MLQDFSNSGFVQFINDVAKNASELPSFLHNTANTVNQDLIDTATRQQVEKNLRQNEAQRVAGQAADWLSNPINLIITFVGILGALILFKKL